MGAKLIKKIDNLPKKFQQVIIFLIFSILYFLDATRQLSIRSIFLHFTPNKEKVLPQRQRHAFVKLAYNCPATAVEQIFNLCDPR